MARQSKYTLMQTKQSKERFVLINKTGEKVFELIDPAKYAELRKKALNNLKQSQFREMCSDLGLHRVIGSVSGKVYYE